jgi:hypothetical protein
MTLVPPRFTVHFLDQGGVAKQVEIEGRYVSASVRVVYYEDPIGNSCAFYISGTLVRVDDPASYQYSLGNSTQQVWGGDAAVTTGPSTNELRALLEKCKPFVPKHLRLEIVIVLEGKP